MKILIIRHADPDYSIDSLTKKGWVEAECLSEKLLLLQVPTQNEKFFFTDIHERYNLIVLHRHQQAGF